MNDKERFWRKVDKTDGCWFWTGYIASDGYGMFSLGKIPVRAHRYSWFLNHGEVPELFVLHTCDNRNCVNPEHLFLGTTLDNVRDMIRKGRNRDFAVAKLTGKDNSRNKLTREDVIEIRRLYNLGENKKSLSIKFGVHRRTIADIVNQITWKDAIL